MNITILGGGHGCYAAAADLSEAGHSVRLWRRDAAALQPLRDAGAITLKDAAGAREVPIALATADIGEAMRGAELIVVPSPAIAQRDIAVQMAPHLAPGQVVFLAPGTFGSFLMARWVKEAGSMADVAWAETGTLPYLARKHGDREVNVTVRAVRLPTGVYRSGTRARALETIRAAYPSVHGCGDALSGALMNAGPIIHPPLIVMNAAPLQHFERWDIHDEGTQPAVRAVTDRLDAERIAVREALGYGAPHYPLADHYLNDRWMYGDAHRQLVKSGDWREHIDLHAHRYVLEDTELGLAFLASVARFAGVDAPVAHGLLAIAGGFLGRDLRRGPRTLEALGLDGLGRDELQRAPGGRMSVPRFAAVGAGRMGRGIAIAFAYAGHRIALVDLRRRTPEAWQALHDEARREIAASLDGLAQLGAFEPALAAEIAARIDLVPEHHADAALAHAELVFEGVPETLEAKREAFQRLNAACADAAILTSTTSSILVTQLVDAVRRPERFFNMHWLNPAYLIPVVEFSTHPGTDPAVVRRARTIMERIGKLPVVCGVAPGYIVPRLQALIMNEAARMVGEGVATAEEIDRATRYGLGLRFAALGVIEFIDFGGADILHHASREMSGSIDAARYEAPPVIGEMMASHRLGLKTGSGFYDYAGRDVAEYRRDVLRRMLGMVRHAGLWHEPAQSSSSSSEAAD